MNILTIKGVKIDGVVACLPENKLDNEKACEPLYGPNVETLIKATGIETRYVANEGTTALDLNTAAAKRLLAITNTVPAELGGVICVTFTPEHLMPGDAAAAQTRLGIDNECIAFDINMACSGYGYGLYVASTLVKATGKKFLLLNGDTQTAYVSKEDKATMPVLSDVGTATLLVPTQENNEWKFSFYSDGSNKEVLYIKAGGTRYPMTQNDLIAREYEDGSKRRDADIYMNGYEVFRFVALDVSRFIKKFMDNIEISEEDINAFVPHQANIYMIQQLTKKLKIDKEKMWKSGDIYGNPASASVPLTIAHNAGKWFADSDSDNAEMLISGFGGGLSISVGKIQLNKAAKYQVFKYYEGE